MSIFQQARRDLARKLVGPLVFGLNSFTASNTHSHSYYRKRWKSLVCRRLRCHASEASWFADSGTTLVATKRRTMCRIPRVRKGWKTRASAAAGLQQSGARALRGRTASRSLAPAMRTAVPAEAGSIVAPPASPSRSLSRKDAHAAPIGQRLRCR